MKLKIKKGDSVYVISGNDKDRTEAKRVLAVYPDRMKILVEGVNVRKKHSRPSQARPQGGIVDMEVPIHYSNVKAAGKKSTEKQ